MTIDRYAESRAVMESARALLPGGVDSPVRSYRAVGGDPVVVAEGRGATVTDVDGNQYVDYVCSYGPLILGHAAPAVVAAVEAAARRGTSFGATTPGEVQLARRVVDALPAVEMVRFVSSGTEAAMTALRLARAATGRDLVLKFEGCYHGHADALLVAPGSGAITLSLPGSAGVPAAFAAPTLVATYNDLDSAATVLDAHSDRVACVIVEPIAANMGVVPPVPSFLEGLRELCDAHGALLVFDEVITGFRVARGGAQALTGVMPDLTVLGKTIGGGLPVGAVGGSRVLMQHLAPTGPVYQAGTLSGNPLAMAAGSATLNALAADGSDAFSRLEALGARLEAGLVDAAAEARVELAISRVGSILTSFFAAAAPRNLVEAAAADTAAFGRFHRAMLDRGVHLAPSQFEAWFVSLAHDDEAIDRTVAAAREALRATG